MDVKALRYTATHEWVQLDGTVATIGISKFAVDQLTDLIMIELPNPGESITQGKGFGEVESVKAVSDLYAPVTGVILDVNNAVKADVQLLGEDPYEKGWLLKVEVDDSTSMSELMDYDTYVKKVSEEAH